MGRKWFVVKCSMCKRRLTYQCGLDHICPTCEGYTHIIYIDRIVWIERDLLSLHNYLILNNKERHEPTNSMLRPS